MIISTYFIIANQGMLSLYLISINFFSHVNTFLTTHPLSFEYLTCQHKFCSSWVTASNNFEGHLYVLHFSVGYDVGIGQ